MGLQDVEPCCYGKYHLPSTQAMCHEFNSSN